MLELRTLGELELMLDGTRLRVSRAREAALLVYLSCNVSTAHRRPDLAQMFWPRSDLKNALHCLSQAIYRLGLEVPGLHFRADSKTVALADGAVSADIPMFRTLLRRGEHGTARALYKGPFLDGFALEGAPELTDWLDGVRAEVAMLAEDMFRVLMDQAENAGEWRAAEDAARALLLLNPCDERAAALEVALLAARGEEARARNTVRETVASLTLSGRTPGVRLGHLASALETGEPSDDREVTSLPLVGREREFESLKDRLSQAQSGRGGLALILGKAGIGKTRLIQHLTRLAALRGFRILSCAGAPALQTVAYAGTREILAGIRSEDLGLMTPARLEVLDELLPRECRITRVRQLEPFTRDWLYAAAAALLESVASARPLLITADDMQWLDEATLGLLGFLARGLGPIPALIIGAARPDELGNELTRGVTPAISINLSELSPGASVALIDAFCNAAQFSLPSSAATAIERRAGGHPFLLLEMLKRLQSDAAPSVPAAKAVRPDSIDHFIAHRLESLSPTARSSVEALAVLGNGSDRGDLASVAGVAEDQLADAVDELVRRGLVRDGEGGVGFLHDLVREATYDRLNQTRRRMLHARAMRARRAGAGADACELAFHANLAKDKPSAFRYATAAARVNERRFGAREAVGYWRISVENAATKLQVAVAKERLAACLYVIGDNREAAALYQELLDIPFISQPRRLLFSARSISLRARMTGDLDDVACGEVLEAADELGTSEERIAIFQPLVAALLTTGRSELVERLAPRITRAVADCRPSSTAVRVQASLAELAALSGRIDEAERYIDLAVQNHDPAKMHQRSRLEVVRASLAYLRGQLAPADRSFAAALDCLSGDRDRMEPASLGNWALVKLEKAEFDSSRDLLSYVVSRAWRAQDKLLLSNSLVNLALLEYERGHMDAATSEARRALEIASERKLARAAYGLCLLGSDPGQARLMAQTIANEEVPPLGEDYSYPEILVARVGEALGQLDESYRRLGRFAQHYSTRDFFCHARIQLEQARLLGRRDRDAGLALAREVRARASDAGAVLLLNRAEALIRQLRHGDPETVGRGSRNPKRGGGRGRRA